LGKRGLVVGELWVPEHCVPANQVECGELVQINHQWFDHGGPKVHAAVLATGMPWSLGLNKKEPSICGPRYEKQEFFEPGCPEAECQFSRFSILLKYSVLRAIRHSASQTAKAEFSRKRQSSSNLSGRKGKRVEHVPHTIATAITTGSLCNPCVRCMDRADRFRIRPGG